ncbi:MAG TPA: hypothetical protein DHW82_07770 [Spirochaetia bacterium]|nr:MAG: hypothetical protein A2Y41_11250 [Spirochaetes bacterium GWB1_36_13]HCL56889.1 hypothetical protein [Spirochaetia bacterium]
MKALITIPHSFFLKKVAGVPLIKRIIKVLQKFGIYEIYILSNILELEKDNEIQVIRKKEEVQEKLGDSYLLIDVPAVFDMDFLKDIYFSKKEGILAFSKAVPYQGKGIFQVLTKDQDIKKAEKLLLKSLRKPYDTFISRTLNRPVSLFVSSFLMKTPITPNWITFIVFLISLAASGLMIFLPETDGKWLGISIYYWQGLLGGTLFHIASVLDGCDGEIARLKFKSSKLGTWLDNISDELTNFIFFGAVGLYSAKLYQDSFYLSMALLSMGLFFLTKILQYTMIFMKLQEEDIAKFDFDFKKNATGFKKVLVFLFSIGENIARNDFLALGMMVAGIFALFYFAAYVIFVFTSALFVSVVIEFVKKVVLKK